jgi:hypothetical protein
MSWITGRRNGLKSFSNARRFFIASLYGIIKLYFYGP